MIIKAIIFEKEICLDVRIDLNESREGFSVSEKNGTVIPCTGAEAGLKAQELRKVWYQESGG